MAVHRLTEEQLASLPEVVYLDSHDKTPGTAPVLAVKRGECGYYPIHTRKSAGELNASLGITQEQAEAMQAGSMFGWHVPAASIAKTRELMAEKAAREAAPAPK